MECVSFPKPIVTTDFVALTHNVFPAASSEPTSSSHLTDKITRRAANISPGWRSSLANIRRPCLPKLTHPWYHWFFPDSEGFSSLTRSSIYFVHHSHRWSHYFRAVTTRSTFLHSFHAACSPAEKNESHEDNRHPKKRNTTIAITNPFISTWDQQNGIEVNAIVRISVLTCMNAVPQNHLKTYSHSLVQNCSTDVNIPNHRCASAAWIRNHWKWQTPPRDVLDSTSINHHVQKRPCTQRGSHSVHSMPNIPY